MFVKFLGKEIVNVSVVKISKGAKDIFVRQEDQRKSKGMCGEGKKKRERGQDGVTAELELF